MKTPEQIAAQKAAQKVRSARWHTANREKANASARAWHEAHKETVTAKQRAEYLADRDSIKARVRAYAAANPDKIRARGAAYRASSPDKIRAAHEAWYKANRARVLAPSPASRARGAVSTQRRRARLAAVENTLTGADVRTAVEMSGGLCAYCLKPFTKPTIDHVVAIARGGPNTADNIVVACKSCNARKGARGVLSMLRYLKAVA